MDIFGLIDEMNPFVVRKDWLGLETKFENLGRSLAPDLSELVARIDVSEYQKRLSDGLVAALAKAKETEARAIYFEYDLDNDWDSQFFICKDYRPLNGYEPGDDDWACEWIDHLDVGAFEPFGELYIAELDNTEAAMGVNSFLIARTVGTFGRCVDPYRSEPVAVCMGFHDQDPVVRIHDLKVSAD